MDEIDLDNRFAYHQPPNDFVAGKHGAVRRTLCETARILNELCPEGREKSLAITKLEEAMMWANAAIARNNSV